ncbi:LPXTG cell wall anchor domain-containing protein [Weissella diestrammenae]|uniref:LPXTG cell wall anchor domain-containing protein n=2 Tax=Weissella diestrammenae TaxID=1162633 RepID=A0A7G9T5I1_9LACO|nr:LPXTG cell wall anchor domain-containing protein [Weissella diestrammenae]QNN75356.1 LPXTG cell wall anchor domain-containing protein [Weissella diestrammenae]
MIQSTSESLIDSISESLTDSVVESESVAQSEAHYIENSEVKEAGMLPNTGILGGVDIAFAGFIISTLALMSIRRKK